MKYSNRKFVIAHALGRAFTRCFNVRTAGAITAMMFTYQAQASCDYRVDDQWSTGFKAEIAIVNDSSGPLNDWQVSWRWDEGLTFDHGWDATISCSGNTCTASPPAWMPVLATGQRHVLGFIAKKSPALANAPAALQLSGSLCNNEGGDIAAPGLWTLNTASSAVQYVSVKNYHKAEVNSFGTSAAPALTGSIEPNGNSTIAIDLNKVLTGVDIRNQRMRDFVFETELLPTAYITANVDSAAIAAMAVGASEVMPVDAQLSVHGVQQRIQYDALVVKRSETQLQVSSLAPIVIDSKQFDMASGVSVLRTIANLTSIGEAVPVYFQLLFNLADAGTPAITMPAAPADPSTLAGEFDALATRAKLTWNDNSNNENNFLVRRKTPLGLWETVANLAANEANYDEALPDQGEFDYKVIAINQSVPSLPTNTVRVEVTDGDPIARGQQIYGESCAGCHGADGSGTNSFPPVNVPRDFNELINYIETNMPLNNPGACDAACASDVAAYIQTLWVTELSCDRTLTPVSYGARQLKILTRSEYQNSVNDLLGVDFDITEKLSADEKVGFFFNNTHSSVVASSYSNYLIVAEELAEWSAQRNFAPALSCAQFDNTCTAKFLDDTATRIFRRPLSSDERTLYSEMTSGTLTNGDIKQGIQMALEAMLSSPQFLYRHELGEPNPTNPDLDNEAFELTSYEMATFLAYTFTGSTPDQVLLDAAANDTLRSESDILAQARRLTNSSTAQRVMGDFVGSWLGTRDLDLAAKDELTWPNFDVIVPHMKEEIRQNFAHAMLDTNESFGSIYNANYSFVNAPLAEHYGIPNVSGNQFRQVSTTDRGGILANGAFMARWGEDVETSPILRSVRVRRRMLCQDQPEPPAGTFEARERKLAELSDLLQDPSTTNQVKYHRLTEDAPCTTCHLQYINPLGFGMEDFDTVGNVRTRDLNGNLVSVIGELYAPNSYANVSEVEPFQGTRGLGQVLAGLPSAQACLPKQMFRYFIGVGDQDIDNRNPEAPQLADTEKAGYACEVDELSQAMMSENPRTMLENFSVLDAVRYRKAWSRD